MLPRKLSLFAFLGLSLPTFAASNPGITDLYHVGFWVRDIAKSRAFYEKYLGFEEPYVLNRATGVLQMVVIKVNERQSIFLFPDTGKILPNGDNLDHLGLETADAAGSNAALAASGVKASPVNKAHVGDLIFGIRDPDGHPYEVTQFLPDGQLMKHQGQNLPATRISARLRSATLAAADLKASLDYYCGRLGFTETWRGGDQVELQIPGSFTYVVLWLYSHQVSASVPHAVPAFTLEVPDVAKAVDLLSQRAAAGGFPPPSAITTGGNGRRQASCVDPDGTRIVLMEAK